MLHTVQGVEIKRGAGVACGLEALFERMQAGDVPGGDAFEHVGAQGLLALGAGRQGEDADDAFARRARLQVAVQMPPDGAVGGVREQVLAQLGVAECLRLARQGANQVAVVDTARSLAVDGMDPR